MELHFDQVLRDAGQALIESTCSGGLGIINPIATNIETDYKINVVVNKNASSSLDNSFQQ